ncbi:MAG: response regulator transcription factor [Dactylosporangium sp.]|nr:response regulator transcription factor [Dactylosporangium sp.]NNJ63771.1 response regulator transcription factor [Dactylosporangium sp.]
MRVLVIEDDCVLADLVADGLRERQMIVDVAYDGVEALNKISVTDYDVLILDRDLPLLHGDAVCQALVRMGSPGRVLMLTAASAVEERVEGLLLGADDYLGKPFAFTELVARVVALGRRSGSLTPTVIRRGDLAVDVGRHEVRRGEHFINLTRKEFGVLVALLRADGQLISAEQLLERVWDEHADPFSTAPRTTIKNLRAKLGAPDMILTVTGRGYRIP